MPQDPDASFAPDVDIDDSQKWRLKLVGLDEKPSQYRDKNKNAMMLIWRFTVHGIDDGVAVLDNTSGDMYEQWSFTGDATYDNPTSGKIAPAREHANALLGHRLDDDEIRQLNQEGWAHALVGKTVIADLEWYSTADGSQKLRVLRLKPDRKAEPAMAAGSKSNRSRRQVDDDDEDSQR